MKKILLISCFILLFSDFATAKHLFKEIEYQEYWCLGRGQSEVVMEDKTRCDCLTETHAIEVDFASKFYEAIGQSFYYSMLTGKRAGILLIIEKDNDYKYWKRLNDVVDKLELPIDTWKIEQDELIKRSKINGR